MADAFGKPFLQGQTFDFNLSDTKDAVAIAFATRAELGVDIETMTRRVDHDAVSKHYFTPEEIDGIANAGGWPNGVSWNSGRARRPC